MQSSGLSAVLCVEVDKRPETPHSGLQTILNQGAAPEAARRACTSRFQRRWDKPTAGERMRTSPQAPRSRVSGDLPRGRAIALAAASRHTSPGA
jgi:hypothetical protein